MAIFPDEKNSACIQIRVAVTDDIDDIMPLYENAKKFMRHSENNSQWTGGYPARCNIMDDIRRKQLYIGTDNEGRVAVAFAFIRGKDPTYAKIYDGKWLDDNLPYGTIHRIASSGRYSRMLARCVEYCLTMERSIRLDTHADNRPMQQAALRIGFRRCGIIHIADGSPRIAFQLLK